MFDKDAESSVSQGFTGFECFRGMLQEGFGRNAGFNVKRGCLTECLRGILNWLFGRMLPLLFDRDARLGV